MLQLGQRLMKRAYLDGLDYEAPLKDLREVKATLSQLHQRRAKAQGGTAVAAIDLEIGAARNELQLRAAALGDLSHGPLRSLWDLKSMLKAMEELHAGEVRALQ